MKDISDEVKLSLEKLIYEYLVKMNYEESAKVFKKEGNIDEVRINESIPALLNWYNIFVETANVRSGNILLPDSLRKIEMIMNKLESDKNKYLKNSNHSKYQGMVGIGDNFDRQMTAQYLLEKNNVKFSQRKIKEYKKIDLKIPFVYTSQFCPSRMILLMACADNKMYFYNISKNIIEYSLTIKTQNGVSISFKECHDGIFVAYALDTYSVYLFKYFDGMISEIKTIKSDNNLYSYKFLDKSMVILYANRILKIFSLAGDLIKQTEISDQCYSLETFLNHILFIKEDTIMEFDYNIETEVRTPITGKVNNIIVKNGYLFVFYIDQIHVFNSFPQNKPICIYFFENRLELKDITCFYNSVAICFENELFYSNIKIQTSNAVGVYTLLQHGKPVLMVLSSDGKILFISLIQ